MVENGPATEPVEAPLSQIGERLAAMALWASCVPLFSCAAVSFLRSPADVRLFTWWGLLIPLVGWLIGALTPRWRHRRWVQVVSGFLLLANPLLLDYLGLGSGPGVTAQIGLAVIFVASFGLSTVCAVVMSLAVMAVLAVDSLVPFSGRPSRTAAETAVLLVYCVVAAATVLLVRRQLRVQSERLDAIEARVRRQEDQDRRRAEWAAGLAAVNRRIHETVLNTLTAISIGIPPADAAKAREICASDVAHLGTGLVLLPDSRLREVVSGAIRSVEHLVVRCRYAGSEDPMLTSAAANVLRDALVEALRNVGRHSGSAVAEIRVLVGGEQLVVSVRDRGVGVPGEAVGNFGLQQVLGAGLASIGGTVSVERAAGGGTLVRLTLPWLPQAEDAEELPASTPVLLAESRALRLALFIPCVMLLVLGHFLAPSVERGWLATALVDLVFVLSLILAVGWPSRWRAVIAVVMMLATVAIYLWLILDPPGCGQSLWLSWAIGLLSGAPAPLGLLALRLRRSRIAVLGVHLAMGVWLAATLGSECSWQLLLTLTVSLSYVAGLIWLLDWVERRFDQRRLSSRRRWEKLAAERAESAAAGGIAEGWLQVEPPMRELLAGIADGSLDPSSAQVRGRAALLAYRLRSRLSGRSVPTGVLEWLRSDLAGVSAREGCVLDLEELTPLRRQDPLPLALVDSIARMIGSGGVRFLRIRAVQEGDRDVLVLLIRRSETVRDVLAEAPSRIGDCELSWFEEEDHDNLLRILIERPSGQGSSPSARAI